jgi:hypothetical protein
VVLVSQGSQQFPENQRLLIELAFLLEQNGQASGAMAILERLSVTDDNRVESARSWYIGAIDEALEEARDLLRAAGKDRLGNLSRALARANQESTL